MSKDEQKQLQEETFIRKISQFYNLYCSHNCPIRLRCVT